MRYPPSENVYPSPLPARQESSGSGMASRGTLVVRASQLEVTVYTFAQKPAPAYVVCEFPKLERQYAHEICAGAASRVRTITIGEAIPKLLCRRRRRKAYKSGVTGAPQLGFCRLRHSDCTLAFWRVYNPDIKIGIRPVGAALWFRNCTLFEPCRHAHTVFASCGAHTRRVPWPPFGRVRGRVCERVCERESRVPKKTPSARMEEVPRGHSGAESRYSEEVSKVGRCSPQWAMTNLRSS